MEGFLNLQIPQWKRVALTRGVALLPAVGVAILSQQNPADSDRMDEMLNVLESIHLPFALVPVLVFTSSPTVMGTFVNGKATVVTGWVLGGFVCVINMYLVFANLDVLVLRPFRLAAFVAACCLYVGFVVFLMRVDPTIPDQQAPKIPTTRRISCAVPRVRRDGVASERAVDCCSVSAQTNHNVLTYHSLQRTTSTSAYHVWIGRNVSSITQCGASIWPHNNRHIVAESC
ncbi:hypothetical protein PHYPSEUDO_011445 [Phytophthora pseudosyringae]|uniref:Uncharacterized protein n=1 Tax=Phytophthora pseudosyringae TaxID=221518 RepID=A0A8T1W4X7_9STRA|nr:hypothetical protein PHYPSEUDO_011445 [Phytophthora pseudosyringae]